MAKQRVLIITGDPIGAKLAGPAIRAWNMAVELSKTNEVKLLSLTGVSEVQPPFDVVHVPAFDDKSFNFFHEWADVVVFQGHAMLVFSALRHSKKIMVVDVYDPMHLEQLEQARELPAEQWTQSVDEATRVLNDQLRRGDFFLCASERQRLFWLGQLAALGRVNPSTYENDPDLTGLIDVAPFGLSRTDPVHNRSVLKGVHPGIAMDDKLLLWSGGLYNWFDPHTLIRAVAQLSTTHDNVRLFFQGTKHPHPGVPEMEIVRTSKDLARDLGVLDRNVFFNDSWVDFDDRQNYLLEADLGVSTHFDHIETTFSFRTRILDYLWAVLPMVVTRGDHFADLVEEQTLGIAVPAEDVGALANAIEKVLFDPGFNSQVRGNIRRVREGYFWDVALAPLVNFIEHAKFAGDHSHIPITGPGPAEVALMEYQPSRVRRLLMGAATTLKNEGVGQFFNKSMKKIFRK